MQENNAEIDNRDPDLELERVFKSSEADLKPTPNNPPWNSLVAVSLWIVSIGLIFVLPPLFVFPYLGAKGIEISGNPDIQSTFYSDPVAVALGLGATFIAHLLTLALAWFIVTNYKKYSFKEMLGWRWGGFKFWHGVLLIAAFYGFALGLVNLLGSHENEMTRILKSSRYAVFLVAIIATFSAPIVEEVVYRGVLYSAFQRSLGSTFAVVLVTLIFAGVHIGQYLPDYATILSVCFLSLLITLVRAKTENLLPCIAVHLVFNALQSTLLILEPYLPLPEGLGTTPETTAAVVNFIINIPII